MATLTIRNLPDEVRNRLRMVAAERGRSMEAEARAALTEKFGAASGPELDAEAVTQKVQAAFAPYRTQRGSAVDALIPSGASRPGKRRWKRSTTVTADCQWAELDVDVWTSSSLVDPEQAERPRLGHYPIDWTPSRHASEGWYPIGRRRG